MKKNNHKMHPKGGKKAKLANLAPNQMQNVACEIIAEGGACDGDCINCAGGGK